MSLRPLVLVAAEPVVHGELIRWPDLDVHPVRFARYQDLMVSMRERSVPMHAHPTVIVCSASLPDDEVGLSGLLEVVADFVVVVGGQTDRSIPAPTTANQLRAAIEAVSRQQGAPVVLPAVADGDHPIRDLRAALGVGDGGRRPAAPRLPNQIDPAAVLR